MAYTLLDIAYEILKDAPHPLTYREIWEQGEQRGLVKKTNVGGKTPMSTFQAKLSVDVRNPTQSKLLRLDTKPKRYFLKSRKDEIGLIDLDKLSEDSLDKKPLTGNLTYKEKDLHPLLAHLAYAANPQFLRERQIHTKTIAHAKSTGIGFREWLHPDMVGVYFPFGEMEDTVIKLSSSLNANSIVQLFSFELKREITKRNYREYFFQAVSNSSWAHEGYLVAAEISDDDDLRRELGRLNNAFGIGIIHLNLEDISASNILFEAQNRPNVDWETINKLYVVNKDFESFISRLNIDFVAGEAHLSKYDDVIENPSDYIREKLKIKTVD